MKPKYPINLSQRDAILLIHALQQLAKVHVAYSKQQSAN